MSTTSDILSQRREKAAALADLGTTLYRNDFRPDRRISSLLAEGDHLQPEQSDPHKEQHRIAGRIMALRKFGKAAFATVADSSGQMQVYIRRDVIGEPGFESFKKYDIGDIIGATGHLFCTKTGEVSLYGNQVVLLTKSMQPLPEKWHGLSDVETRYRQRYVNLLVTPKSKETFLRRIEIIKLIREFFTGHDFFEVETPMMQTIPGGATAKPFKTHHNALGIDLYLRIAPELYLKRLLVGGFERVFEINRNFRNEGLSTRHNPEFTMLEFYQAYATYEDLMDLSEELIASICETICGTLTIIYQSQSIDFTRPWRRLSMDQALIDIGAVDPDDLDDESRVFSLVRKHGITLDKQAGIGKAKTALFEHLVEDKLVDPTFITAYPTEVSPLSRQNETNPEITDRFELFIAGREIANGFSELNDPVEQLQRFEKQISERGDDEEIHPVLDTDYIRALEFGLPPAAGEGIGIDRLVMLLTDSPSIRDVILFPHLKPR